MIERIVAFKDALGDVGYGSVEKTIENFQRDPNPEKELVIWERIASTFQTLSLLTTLPMTPNRKEVFSVLVGASMGAQDWNNITPLAGPDKSTWSSTTLAYENKKAVVPARIN